MPKARLIFDGDGVYTEKEARIHKLTQETENKIDNIPGIVNDVNSTSTTDALSANMGKYLQDQINNISGTTIFLSTWDCTTGLPETDPAVDPYTYKTGNYYIVGKVAASGGTNYRPHGATHTHGVPSTSVETNEINVNDWYIYDGQTWVIQPASTVAIVIDDMLKPNSTNAVENRAIYSAVSQKQDKILDLATIREGAALGTTSIQPGDNITELTNNVGYQTAGDVAAAIEQLAPHGVGEGVLTIQKNSTTIDTFSANAVQNKTINIPIPTTVSELSDANDYATKVYVDNKVENSKYVGPTAPSNPTEGMLWYDTTNDILKVYNGTSWDVTGKEYSAGKGISIGDVSMSDMQGPAPDGFHIPLSSEWTAIINAHSALGTGSTFIEDLKIPNHTSFIGTNGRRGATGESRYLCSNKDKDFVSTGSGSWIGSGWVPGYGLPIRAFKDIPVIPNSSWTIIFDGSSVASGAGIFRDQTMGLVSISKDGINWFTIQDKNLGAVNVGDVGYYYQWGNNNGFIMGGITEMSSIQVDASTYGPGNYYSSSTFITAADRDSSNNTNLRGGVTQRTIITYNAITNTGVLSINGQTGNVNGLATTSYVDTTIAEAVGDSKYVGPTAPSNPTEGMLWYDTTNDVLKSYDGTSWNVVGNGDMNYSDFNFQSKSGATVTLDLSSTITPSADFTVNAPATIKDGQRYILRVNNGSTAYTMTLGTNITNPFGVVTTLTSNGLDQFVFLAIGGNLELQPEGGIGGGEGMEYVTQTEYDNLPSSKETDGKSYFIYSGHGSGIVDNTPFGSSWDGDTTHAPSKNAIYDVLGDVETLLANL